MVHGDSALHAHQGQRVVEYQHALQAVSDPLLGWTTDRRPALLRAAVPRHEVAPSPSTPSNSAALADYARILGHLLAKAHARTSGASTIAGYVGSARTNWTGP